MNFTPTTLLKEYISEFEKCARLVSRLKKLQCVDLVFLDLKSECLSKFSALEADKIEDFYITYEEIAIDFET